MSATSDTAEAAELYDAEYYATSLGPAAYRRDDRWLAFFGAVAREIVRSLAPRTVFDAGCAMGMLVESLWDLGVEAAGMDISSYAISQVRPDMRPHCSVGSVADALPGRYDLVTCIEVLEHVEPEIADLAVARLTAAADTVLFSSTPTDFAEPTHVNVRPPIAWIRSFAAHGFRPDLRFDATFLSPQAMLFRRGLGHDDDDVAELFAYHVLIRSALIEREQRIGKLQADHAAELSNLAAASQDVIAQARAEADRARSEAQSEAERAGAQRAQSAELLDAVRREAADAATLRDVLARREAQALDALALEHAGELERVRSTHADALAALAADHAAAVAAAMRAADERAASLRVQLERVRDRARADASAARAEVAAARDAAREESIRIQAQLAPLAESTARIEQSERRAAVAYDALVGASAELTALRALCRNAADPGAFELLARRHAELLVRFERLVRADIELYDADAARLDGAL